MFFACQDEQHLDVQEVVNLDATSTDNLLVFNSQEDYAKIFDDETLISNKTNIEVPDNIFLLNIPPYSPELNPCEPVWQYIKSPYKNRRFETMESLKTWLHKTVNKMSENTIKSIEISI